MDAQTDDMRKCRRDADFWVQTREKLPEAMERVIANSQDPGCFTHIDFEPIRSHNSISELISRFRNILFPGYFTSEKLDRVNLTYNLGESISVLYDVLAELVTHMLRHACFRYDRECIECKQKGYEIALDMVDSLVSLQQILATDVRATYEGDPAAKSHDEIIFSYPGVFATAVYRVAHRLFELEVPLLPRIMTEHAHSVTGIDIHPGAEIGERFVIDHGTGVVIGETARIGRNVRIYQGVTLGALSIPTGQEESLKPKKRHPTVEDDVTIYSGATILGGDTVIGARSVIGGNVWLTKSVPPDTKVLMEKPRLIYK